MTTDELEDEIYRLRQLNAWLNVKHHYEKQLYHVNVVRMQELNRELEQRLKRPQLKLVKG